MKPLTTITAILFILSSCGSNDSKEQQTNYNDNRVDSLLQKVNELTEKEKAKELEKQQAAEQAKADELQGKKNLIIEQIRAGMALKPSVYGYDPIGMGGINNAKLKIENDLVGIVFQVVKVRYTVYLDNGVPHFSEEYTFTNLKPGEARERALPGTGNRGTTFTAVVFEIQSKWLTDGKPVKVE